MFCSTVLDPKGSSPSCSAQSCLCQMCEGTACPSALKDGKVLGFVRPPSVTTAAENSNGQCLQSSLLVLKVQHLFCTNSCRRFTVNHRIKSYLSFGPDLTFSSKTFLVLSLKHNTACTCTYTWAWAELAGLHQLCLPERNAVLKQLKLR